MVYLKVSDGNETRRLQVTPGEISFDQLKEQLATFFPQALGSDLSLQYHDADGDVITLSSDQELQDALSQIQEGGTWKVYIRNGGGAQKSPRLGQRSQSRRRNGCEASLFHRLFEPSVKPFGPFSDVWNDLEQHLQLLHQLHSELFSNDGKEAAKTEKDTAEVTSNSETSADTSTPSSTGDPDEEVKSKPHAAESDKKEESSSNGGGSSSSEPVWQTRRFLTWEPRVHIGPFGFFHSHLTPVIYKVSFRSSNDGYCSAAKGDKKTESKTQEHAEAAKEEETPEQVPGSAATDEAQGTSKPESATTTVQ